jgi:hypothetical protein
MAANFFITIRCIYFEFVFQFVIINIKSQEVIMESTIFLICKTKLRGFSP